jgi:ribonuclease Z
MRCDFRPRLVNGPFEDPVLYVAFGYRRRALLFDIGDIQALPPRDLLKISHVFVSHTHMDHFCGFDRLLRICLGRDKHLQLFGPEGFIENLAGKLAGYAWDLVDNYDQALHLTAVEIRPDGRRIQVFDCRNRFVPAGPACDKPFDEVLVREPSFRVQAAVLEHSSPCLAFCLTEHFHVNVLATGLEDLGLAVGPWITDLKAALYAGSPPKTPITAATCDGGQTQFELGQLAASLTRITPGQKIAYVADAAGTASNIESIVGLVRRANALYIETPFLQQDAPLALRRRHLIAAQAGIIAGRAGVERLIPMHFSPRYSNCGEKLAEEAFRAMAATPADPE